LQEEWLSVEVRICSASLVTYELSTCTARH